MPSEAEQRAVEWRKLKPAEQERRIIERLLKGDVFQESVSQAIRASLDVPVGGVEHRMSEWRERGYVIGLVPLLSDEGRRYFRGLNALPRALETHQDGGPSQGADCPYCGRPRTEHAKVRCEIRSVTDTEIAPQTPKL